MNRKLLPMLACGLLLHTALCGCAAKPQDKAVAEIRALGGVVFFDEESPGRPVTCVMFSATKAFDAGLRHLREWRQLRMLDLRRTRVTGAGVQDLQKALPNVKIDR